MTYRLSSERDNFGPRASTKYLPTGAIVTPTRWLYLLFSLPQYLLAEWSLTRFSPRDTTQFPNRYLA